MQTATNYAHALLTGPSYEYGEGTIVSTNVCMLEMGEAKCVRTTLREVFSKKNASMDFVKTFC